MTKKYYCKDCGNKICRDTSVYGQGRCLKCAGKNRINKERYVDHFCKELNCNNKISYETWKTGGGRCKSCASLINKGKHNSPKTEFKKGQVAWNKKKNCKNYNWGRKKVLPKNYCKCGKEICYGSKRCQKCHLKFIYNSKPKCIGCGKQLTDYRSGRCHSCEGKKRWKNKKYRDKTLKATMQGRLIKPNKPEKLLTKLLNKWLKKEYKFVGDGKVILGGFNPDFINCNGQKKIIEHYGDYFHNLPNAKKRDKRRLKTYKSYGYKTLIVWEHELKKLDKLKEKVVAFNRRKTIC